MNDRLRDAVTSIGFSLSLSKSQIELLVMLHHFSGHCGLSRSGRSPMTYVATVKSLDRRGLVTAGSGGTLSRAGELVCGLLEESGIYAETLDRKGIERADAA